MPLRAGQPRPFSASGKASPAQTTRHRMSSSPRPAARITELEAAIAKGEALLNDPELYAKDPQRFATISAGVANARAEKDAAEERWLMLAEQVEG